MKRLLLTCVLLLAPAIVHAQTVVNPATFEFTPSAQHDAVNPLDGLAVVVSYDVLISTQAAPTVTVATIPCGKPTATAGKLTCTIPQSVKDALTKNVVHVAKERANGQAGLSAVSALGGPFGFAGPAVLTAGGPPEPKL